MKKKTAQEEKGKGVNKSQKGQKPATSQVGMKNRRSRLEDITNMTPDHPLNRKPKSQSKSVKSLKKTIFNTLEVYKECRDKSESVQTGVRYGSSNDQIKYVEPFTDTLPNEAISQSALLETILKDKLTTVEEQNKFLAEMNKELKGQLAKMQDEVLHENRYQGVMRDQNKSLMKKFDEEETKWKSKETQYKTKLKSLNKEIQQLREEREIMQSKAVSDLKSEELKHLKVKSKIQLENGSLIKELGDVKGKFWGENAQNIKKIKLLESEVMQAKQQLQDQENSHIEFVDKVVEQMRKIEMLKDLCAEQQDQDWIIHAIAEVNEQISRLSKQNQSIPTILSQFQNLQQLHQQQSELSAQLETQIHTLYSQIQSLNTQIETYCSQISTLTTQLDHLKSIDTQSPLTLTTKKLQETKNSLQYWKKKFDECKLENIKYRKESETQQEQIRVTLLTVDRLESQNHSLVKRQEQNTLLANESMKREERMELESVRRENSELKRYKFEMEKEKGVLQQKLNVFREKVIDLEARLRDHKRVKVSLIHETPKRQGSSTSFVLNQSAIGERALQTPPSRYFTASNHQYHHQSLQSHNRSEQKQQPSRNLMEYKGDTQAKLENQFRSNKFLSISPQKPVYSSSIIRR